MYLLDTDVLIDIQRGHVPFPANSTRLFTALQRAKAKSVEPQSVNDLYEKLGLGEDDSSDIASAS